MLTLCERSFKRLVFFRAYFCVQSLYVDIFLLLLSNVSVPCELHHLKKEQFVWLKGQSCSTKVPNLHLLGQHVSAHVHSLCIFQPKMCKNSYISTVGLI